MSWLSRALGIPGSLDEFVEKASGQQGKINITVGRYNATTSYVYTYFIKLEADNVKFVMDDNFIVGKYDPLVKEKVKTLESGLLKQARGIQDQLKQKGLESRLCDITGKSISLEHMPQEYNHMQGNSNPAYALA